MSNSLQPHRLWPTRLLHPWDFPGKSTGVGCHCLLQGGASGKESSCQCRRCKRCRFSPLVRKIPWRKKWQPLQYSCLENLMDRGAWWATVHGVTKSRTRLKRLSSSSSSKGKESEKEYMFICMCVCESVRCSVVSNSL